MKTISGLPRRLRSSLSLTNPQPAVTGRRLNLDSVPTEILLTISNFLPPESRAALALLCHEALARLGSNSIRNLDRLARYQLLILLDRDKTYLPDVFCTICEVFHSPKPKSGAGTHSAVRVCERLARSSKQPAPRPPPSISSFAAVSSAIKCHEKGLGTSKFGPQSLNSERDVAVGRHWKIIVQDTFKVVDGHLLRKAESVIFLDPRIDRKERVEMLSKRTTQTRLLRAFGTGKHDHGEGIAGPCSHIGWAHEVPHYFEKCPRGDPVCAWTHVTPCSSLWCEIADFRSLRDFYVAACHQCAAEYTCGLVDLDNHQGRALVLTSWRDLGPGRSPEDREWRLHLRETEDHGPSPFPSIWQLFEHGSIGFGLSLYYRPTIFVSPRVGAGHGKTSIPGGMQGKAAEFSLWIAVRTFAFMASLALAGFIFYFRLMRSLGTTLVSTLTSRPEFDLVCVVLWMAFVFGISAGPVFVTYMLVEQPWKTIKEVEVKYEDTA